MESDIDNGSSSAVVADILKDHPALVITQSGRVRCFVTNHEMPCREDAIQQHINGKKYKRLTASIPCDFNYNQYEPHLKRSIKKGHEHQLFCALTLRHVNKIPSHVLQHVTGKRYLKAKARWEICQESGEKFIPTPLLTKHRQSDAAMKEDSVKENGIESDDSFSDLYPAEYFERLTLSSADENEAQVKSKPKKKKKVSRTIAQADPKKKRKSTAKDQSTRPKKSRLSKSKVGKTKNSGLIVF